MPHGTLHRPPTMKPAVTAVALAIGFALAPTVHAQQPTARRAPPARRFAFRSRTRSSIAQAQRQTIEIARAGVVRAEGQRLQARSQYFPQLNGTAAYTKTLKSQFSSFASSPRQRPSTRRRRKRRRCARRTFRRTPRRSSAPARSRRRRAAPRPRQSGGIRSEPHELRREESVESRADLLAKRLHRRPDHGAESSGRARSSVRRTSKSARRRRRRRST